MVARDFVCRRLPSRSAMVVGATLNRRHIDECFEETPTGQVAQLVAAIREVVARDGIEPPTHRFSVYCSTN